MIRQDNEPRRLQSSDLIPCEVSAVISALRAAYHDTRFAKEPYPVDVAAYDRAVTFGTTDAALPHFGLNSDEFWVVRGAKGSLEQTCPSRLSINASLSPEILRAIDGWMLGENIPAHYKFPAPRIAHEIPIRHDSITVFLPHGVERAQIRRLADDVAPFIRGDSLIGESIAPGVRITNSIPAAHLHRLTAELRTADPSFADAIEAYASPAFPKNGSTPKSCPPGTCAAILQVLGSRGFEAGYDSTSGFAISGKNPLNSNIHG